MCCPILPFAAIAQRNWTIVMTRSKPDPAPADAHIPMPSDMLNGLQSEMEALLRLLPGSALHLSPPCQPVEEAVESGFDNMPV